MSRVIKFRAWDAGRGGFNYKILVGNTEDDNSDLYTAHCILIDGKWVNFDEYDDIVIEQFTGLKDVNGVEIYEGDILDHHGFKVTVKWHNEYGKYYLGGKSGGLGKFKAGRCKVIGNIHKITP